MTKEFLYYGKVDDNGNLQGIPKKQLASDLMAFIGKPIELIIRRKIKHRSYQQNRLWWLYMGILGSELGYDKDEMHDICKIKFLSVKRYAATIIATSVKGIFAKQDNDFIFLETGEMFYQSQLTNIDELINLGSTAKLTTVEFMELIDKLVKWSAETFGIVLPAPAEQINLF